VPAPALVSFLQLPHRRAVPRRHRLEVGS
jgi:hypothetical protein